MAMPLHIRVPDAVGAWLAVPKTTPTNGQKNTDRPFHPETQIEKAIGEKS
jgi:hypothetical protein